MTRAAQTDISPTPSTRRLKDYIFTSESVSEGHPDKICDQISDAILDAYLAADPNSRVAVETATTTNFIALIGEVRGPESITRDVMEDIARQTIKNIGYEQKDYHWKTVEIDCRVHQQSVDIAQGVDTDGAGDQGIMFGYACRETPSYMPAAIQYSHEILRRLSEMRHSGVLKDLGPDAKAQVSLEYKNDMPVRATSVVVSTQHDEKLSQRDVRDMVRPVVESVLPDGWMPAEDELYVNPTGRFVIGGPVGDAGLTGRKIIVDTYGGAAPHGGGAFSGKDPTKVDRSAAYAARYLAKNIVAAGYADKCTIQLSYAIGVAKPISVYLNCHETGNAPEADIVRAITQQVDLSPRGIREHLRLNRPIYARTAAYGHFGREPEADGGFSWEKTDLIAPLRQILG
jgi:S-adenosylmethionine synthetase